MARFERDSKRGPPKRGSRSSSRDGPRGGRSEGSRSRRSFDGPRGRSSEGSRGEGFRERRSFGSDHKPFRREITKTKVTCSSCGDECEVPFKPTSSKPVFCDNCFSKKDKKSSINLDEINEKLDKIMKALKIK